MDIAALKRGEPGAVGDLRSALLDHGYFYCANVVEIPSEYIRSIYAYSRRVHALPSEVKRKYAQRGGTGVRLPVDRLLAHPALADFVRDASG